MFGSNSLSLPAFATAQPCLFIFDILHFNGSNLMDKPLHERRDFLMQHVVSLPNEIMYSEQTAVDGAATLKALMSKVMKENLEGLVLKDKNSTYEPGKRHWLKVRLCSHHLCHLYHLCHLCHRRLRCLNQCRHGLLP